MFLAQDAVISLLQAALAAGATEETTGLVDMSGHRACTFVLVIAEQDALATIALQIQESDGVEEPVDIAGAVATSPVNSDAKLIVVEVHRRSKRYLNAVVTRAGTGDTATGGLVAIRSGSRTTPVGAEASQAATPVVV